MEINAGMVGAGVAVLGLAGGWIGNWVNSQISSVRATQKTLFEKKDEIEKDLYEFKIDVARNYVNRDAMDKLLQLALAPLVARLDELHKDFRDMKK